MKFERLKGNKTKKIIIGMIVIIAITIVGILATSKAKYRHTQSIPLVRGVINYKPYDMNIVAIYQEDENGEYQYTNSIPTSGYNFSDESYCETRNSDNSFVKDESVTITYDAAKQGLYVEPITKQTKCYLYFSMIRDSEKPVVERIETTETTKTSIKVSVTARDNEGVTTYYYSINGGEYTEETTNTHTFSGLIKGTTYTISVKVKDAANNESDVKTESMATKGDPAKDTILAGVTASPGSTNFWGIETGNKGILTGTDDDGTTYYYRGAVTNNYLKFGKNSDGKEMWWRIIRINGDGTIRIIYDGTAYHANGTSTSDSIAVSSIKFNSEGGDNAYVGFKYGATGQTTYEATHKNTNKSTILTALETWYTNNLASYANRIDTNAGFCNDRSINTGTTKWWSSDTKKGYGTNYTAYGPYGRILLDNNWKTTQTPTFNCPNNNDLFTVTGASKGNKSLTYPIGLITVDELIYAGGFGGKESSSYYLYNGQGYWTMSPSDYYGGVRLFDVNVAGNINNSYMFSTSGVRPVINLKSDVPITGKGTQNDPYVVN